MNTFGFSPKHIRSTIHSTIQKTSLNDTKPTLVADFTTSPRFPWGFPWRRRLLAPNIFPTKAAAAEEMPTAGLVRDFEVEVG
jgi:hypothetical protein